MPIGPISASSYLTLTAMITPALFMTATASLIISTSNRMSRIVDRIRVQIDFADRLDRGQVELDYLPERRERVQAELCALESRSDRVRLALTLLYLALCAFIGTSLTLAIDVLLGSLFMGLPTFLAVVGVALMLWASMSLTREAHRALRSNRDEVQFHRELSARRAADTGAPPHPDCRG
jgi:hypothetical protein